MSQEIGRAFHTTSRLARQACRKDAWDRGRRKGVPHDRLWWLLEEMLDAFEIGPHARLNQGQLRGIELRGGPSEVMIAHKIRWPKRFEVIEREDYTAAFGRESADKLHALDYFAVGESRWGWTYWEQAGRRYKVLTSPRPIGLELIPSPSRPMALQLAEGNLAKPDIMPTDPYEVIQSKMSWFRLAADMYRKLRQLDI